MGFLKNLFKNGDTPINSIDDFWQWFALHAAEFHEAIKVVENMEPKFHAKLSPKLQQLCDGIYTLAGMFDEKTAELILTPDGDVRLFAFTEELVAAAPKLDGWKFTALKPPANRGGFLLKMNDFEFSSDNMRFFVENSEEFPDEVNIRLVHDQYSEENRDVILSGAWLFLENTLGELNFATLVDDFDVAGAPADGAELQHLSSLEEFLTAREMEFFAKYAADFRTNTDEDAYVTLEAEMSSGLMYLAMVDSTLMSWDRKPSHPWMASIDFSFDGEEYNGHPDSESFDLLQRIEDEIMLELKDSEGYLNIGHDTGEGHRTIYFACREFRRPSRVLAAAASRYADRFPSEIKIFKDKYWRSLSHWEHE